MLFVIWTRDYETGRWDKYDDELRGKGTAYQVAESVQRKVKRDGKGVRVFPFGHDPNERLYG